MLVFDVLSLDNHAKTIVITVKADCFGIVFYSFH